MKTSLFKRVETEFKREDVMRITSNAYKADKKAIDREIRILAKR